jgi:hypothetical protein
MKIYSYFNEDGSVCNVHLLDDEKNKDAEEKAKEYNKKLGREAYRIFTIPDGMEEVILFLIGEKKYKVYADIDDLDDTLNEVGSDIRGLHDDAFEMTERLERIEKMFEKFKKEFCDKE